MRNEALIFEHAKPVINSRSLCVCPAVAKTAVLTAATWNAHLTVYMEGPNEVACQWCNNQRG